MHFGYISVNLARNWQNFNAGVLLKEAEIKGGRKKTFKILNEKFLKYGTKFYPEKQRFAQIVLFCFF